MVRKRRRFGAGFKAKVALESVRSVKAIYERTNQSKVNPNQVTL